jgi:hypothetical protein
MPEFSGCLIWIKTVVGSENLKEKQNRGWVLRVSIVQAARRELMQGHKDTPNLPENLKKLCLCDIIGNG